MLELGFATTVLCSAFLRASAPQEPQPSIPSKAIAACESTIAHLAVSPDGYLLFLATDRGALCAWDRRKQSFRWRYESKVASNFAGLAATDAWVVTAQALPSLEFFDARSGEAKATAVAGYPMFVSTCVACDPRGRWGWLGMDSGVVVRALPSGSTAGDPLSLQNDGVSSMAFDSDARVMAVGGRDRTIRFVNASEATIVEKKIFEGHTGAVTALVFGSGDATLFSGSDDRTIRGWAMESGKQTFALETYAAAVRSIAIDPEYTALAWGDDEGSVFVWDLVKNEPRITLKGAAKGPVGGLVFMDKGKSLAAAMGDRSVTVWDLSKVKK